MDSTRSRVSRESTEGFSSEEDGDCDVFLSDSDSERRADDPCQAGPAGPPAQARPPLTRPQAFIPHPMSASHLKKPLENIYFALAHGGGADPSPGTAGLGKDWQVPTAGQRTKRFVNRGLKRRWEWEDSRQHDVTEDERTPHAKTRGDLLFAQKCNELQVFIRPLTVLLDGLKSGRYNRGLSNFQQSVAMDRIQRIVGVLQKPSMGERYLGTLLQVEMMLKVWFPHVTVETTNTEGSGPTGPECSARKHARSSSSGTSSSWESLSPPSSRRQSFSDGGVQELRNMVAARNQQQRPEPGGGPPEGEAAREGLMWICGPGHHHAHPAGAASALRCFALVMQDSSVTSTTRRLQRAVAGGPARPGRCSSAPPCLPTQRGDGAPMHGSRGLPVLLPCDSIVLLEIRERPGDLGTASEGPVEVRPVL
ncbi:uncharacterized protein LOC144489402 [Mustelus asterias]